MRRVPPAVDKHPRHHALLRQDGGGAERLGRARSWGCHMVHHALYQKQNYSYAGVIEALSGAPFDVRFHQL